MIILNVNLSELELRILRCFIDDKFVDLPILNMTPDLVSRDTKVNIYVVRKTLEKLVSLDLLKKDTIDKESNIYLLTDKGKALLLNEKLVKRIKLKEKIIWSIAVPLLVAILGTLLTQLLI